MSITPEQIDSYKSLLFDLIPADGSGIGNTSIRAEFLETVKSKQGVDLEDNDYWIIRDRLIDDGRIEKGRGYGGSVRRVLDVPVVVPPTTPTTPKPSVIENSFSKESDLYEPFHATIRQSFVKDYRIKHFVSQITANAGKKYTGGKWTRPDITLIAVKVHAFIPGKTLEIVTFEVKPIWDAGIHGVYETAAHSVFANKSYLSIHINDPLPAKDQDRLERECKRFGVGLVLFRDPANWDTFEVVVEAEHNVPDPDEANGFIITQMNEPNKEALLSLIR